MVTPQDAHKDDRNDQLPVLSADSFAFDPDSSTAVVSNAYKFVIPVPAMGEQAEPLVYPGGHPQAGEPVVDDEGNLVGDRGLVFFNEKDRAWQAVPADGTGVIIINEVTPAQAAQLDEKVRSLVNHLSDLTLSQIKETLAYSRTVLKLGDIYNSTRDYAAQKLVTPPTQSTDLESLLDTHSYGFKQRASSDTCQAVYVPDAFTLTEVTASAQIFTQGGVIVEQEGQKRGIQPDVFVRTYRLASGVPINSLKTDIVSAKLPEKKS